MRLTNASTKKLTLAQLRAQLPEHCHLAVLQGRVVIVWTGNGPTPREVTERFGTLEERRSAQL